MRKVLILSLPLVISNLMHVFYNIADTAWLGMLGKDELAAMAFAFPILFLIVSVGVGIGVGGSIMVSHAEGAGDSRQVSKVAGQTFIFTLVLSAVISLAGVFLSGYLVRLMGAAEEVTELAVAYLRIIFSGVILIFSFFVFNEIMRGWGNTKTPMKIMVASNILNIALDPLLIFGVGVFPAMGISGAALATVLSRFAASAAGVFILFRGSHALRLSMSDLKPDPDILRRIFVIGWPAIVEHALKAVGIMILTSIVAVFGTVYAASFGIGMRIFSVVVMPSLAISYGTAAAAGQNFGAGLYDRARRLARDTAVFTFAMLSLLGLALFLARYRVASIFMGAGEVEVISSTASFITRLSLMAPFLGTSIALRGAFKGAGRTFHSMLIGMLGLLGFRVVYAWAAASLYGSVTGIWDSFTVSGAAELALCAAYYRYTRWHIPSRGMLSYRSDELSPETPDLT